MMKKHPFGSGYEALLYPLALIAVMWLIFWADHLFAEDFYKYGVKPKTISSLKGILFMPLIHARNEIEHIINNSFPTLILLGTLVYYYRDIALKVFLISWLLTGFGLWLFAENNNSYHIGMSGVIYALAAFNFTSGVLRNYLPLQGISLFVAFLYGSMIWGIFPMETHVSWEGHLSGMITGVILAFAYRKQGPQRPKYQFEIEKELGIEPPDFEAEWNEKLRQAKEAEERKNQGEENDIRIVYHYTSEANKKKEQDDSDQQ